MFARLNRLLRRSKVHIECRHCGTAVTRQPNRCPVCQGTEFARYDLSAV